MSVIMQGGWVMIAIILASIIALAVFLERVFYLHTVSKNASIIRKEMQRFPGIKVGEAISICSAHPGVASHIIQSGLTASPSRQREDIERAMEDAARSELASLTKNLPILATIVNISTLLGLLGTVLGMIGSTSVLASQGLGNAGDLIGGISQALITTAAGLIVAIPGQIAYNFLNTRIDSLIIEIESTALELIKILKATQASQSLSSKSFFSTNSANSSSNSSSSSTLKRW